MISEIIQTEIQNYEEGGIEITPGYRFSQYDTINRINLYLNNRFQDLNDPTAIFWNLSNDRRILFAKSIDADSKDFYVNGRGVANWFQSWIINVRFKKWVKDTRFALTLDDTSESTATYGSSVWKKCKTSKGITLKEVNLTNLYFDQTVENIIESPVVELHYLSEVQIRAKYPEKASEVVVKAKEARDNEDNESETTVEQYEIWERWGAYEVDGKDKYMHFIGAGYGDFETILLEEEIKVNSDGMPKEFPYFDFHVGKYNKRWLRLGVVERLFDLQEQANTLVNQNAEANSIASLLLFRTSDAETNGNILQSAVSGQIINTQDMQQLGIDNRALNDFLAQLQNIERQADALCFINESISGETPPSGVPFRSLAVSTNAARSTFKYIKTSIVEKMGYILQEQILPDVMKEWNREDTIEISEDENDIRIYDERVIDKAVQLFKKDKAKKNLAVAEEDIEFVREETRKRLERSKRVEKVGNKFFDFEWGISMNPTGESVDKNVQNAAIDGALEMMIQAPAVVNTPLFKQKLENNGINPFRLTVQEQEALQPAQPKKVEAPAPDKLSQLISE